MSCIRLHHLSSVTIGVLAAQAFRTNGVCAPGFVAMQLMVFMWQCAVAFFKAFSLRVETEIYKEHNEKFVQQCSDTYETRQNVLGVPPVSYVLLVHIVGGVCEAFAATMTASTGDVYIVAAVLWLLSGRWERFGVICFAFLLLATQGMPSAHGLMRCLSCCAAIACQHVQSQWRSVHPIVACLTVILLCGRPCTNRWRALSPSLLATIAIESRLNPKLILTVFLCAWLV